MGVFGAIVVGIVLILFYKLFFGSEEERKGCWQHVVLCFLTVGGVGWLIARDIASDSDPAVFSQAFGFVGAPPTADACTAFGYSCARAALFVTSVVPGSAAEAARLPTSTIYDMEGEALDGHGLAAVRGRHKDGDMIPFLLYTNDGRHMRYWVRLGNR